MSMLSRFATLGGAPTDPYWANVSFLLVGNGANGTTTNIVDSSSNNFSITIGGNTVISTTQSQYGSGSVYFDGVGDTLIPTTSNLFNFGTGNFTVEGWLYSTLNGTVFGGIFTNGPTSTGSFGIGLGIATGDTTKLQANFYGGAGISCATNFPNNRWVYFAVCRNGSTMRIYLDGVLDGTNTSAGSNNTTNTPALGEVWKGYGGLYKGYMYDIRVTKGVGRYTDSTMTVPTGPLPTTGP